MAVMTSQHSDGVAFEHKIEPVPSSDKMALDLDINGDSNRDETNNDISDETNVNKVAVADSDEVALKAGVNGDANFEAFSSNKTIVPQSTEIALESQATEPSPSSLPNSSLPLDSNTTDTDLNSSSLEAQPLENSDNFDPSASAIEAAVEDTAPTTSVPPVVEPQESDLRHSSTPLAPAESLIPSEQNQLANLNLDSQDSIPSPPVDNATNVLQNAEADLAFTSEPAVTTQEPSRSPKSEKMEDEDLSLPLHGEALEPADEQVDTNMLDAYPSSTKVSRGRESDDEPEPSAKRTKTDDIEMTDEVAAPTENGETSHEGAKLNEYQVKEIVKVLRNVLRTKAGGDIKLPVVVMWPSLSDSYLAKVSHPTDLDTIERNLKSGVLGTMEEFTTEVNYLYDNSVLYNGEDHIVSKRIRETRDNILKKVASIPPESAVVPKKEKKARHSTPQGDSAPRAPARRAARDPPAPAAANQTFALDPTTNTPLIRRDSTKGDGGRPKREIHPPKNKDLPYSVRPKTKKHSTELKFCEEVLTELLKQKNYHANWPFVAPVDPIALNIPNYFQVIKKPMDLSTIDKKLKQGQYEKAAEFEKDIRLMLNNCYKFNPPPNNVYNIGKELESIFDDQWARKDDYISQHTPAAASPGTDDEEEDDEEEEEETGGQQAAMATLMSLKERLLDEQTKLIQLMNDKSTDPSILLMQQDMVDLIKKRLESTEAQAKKPAKKAKAPKPKKIAVPAKKSSAKKTSGNRQRYMGTLEKETISNGLGLLPDGIMENVVAMIKAERPEVENETDGTMELDIDIISVPLLWKIHTLIMQYNPEVEQHLRDQMRAEHDGPRSLAKAGPKKKNKPMSKGEQERKIKELTEKAEMFTRGSQSQEPMQTVETQEEESSGDEESDSEEE